ncbi:MAG TPA: hypothetical protein VIM63_18770 [Rhodoferax sp.]
MHFSRFYPIALLTFAGFGMAQPAPALPLLRCAVTYAGSTQTIEATPVTDPYPVASVDIGGRFWFKPVVVGQGSRVDYVKLYAYLDTASQPLLIQEVKYLPPFTVVLSPTSPASLTGEQHLYAGHLERELIYNCSLQGVQP